MIKWLRDGEAISLRPADLRGAARLVIEGGTPGWVEKFDRQP